MLGLSPEVCTMASKYEEMCDVAKTARKNWLAHRERCRQYMASLVVGMLRYCGIPNDALKFSLWDEASQTFIASEQDDLLYPAAMTFDENGDCRLGIRIALPRRWVSFGLFVSEKEGKVNVRLGPDKETPIDLGNELECAKFYESIVANIKKVLTAPSDGSATSIGFKRSPVATDEENQSPKSSNVA
jgi:hypothetical protein